MVNQILIAGTVIIVKGKYKMNPMKGTYAKLVPCQETRDKISLILKMFNIENHASPNDLHTTLIYSRQECPTLEAAPVGLPVTATGKAFSIFPNADGGRCLVLELESDDLQLLHGRLRAEHGATHDFESYKPHITLSYDYSSDNVPGESMLEHFWHLKFDQFVVEPLNFNWGKE